MPPADHGRRPAAAPDRLGDLLRVTVLVALGAAPLAMGAVHEPVFIPLLIVCSTAGGVSAWRAYRARRRHARPESLPGGPLLAAAHLLVLLQLVPLPPALLARISHGSFSFRDETSLVPLTEWKPISVNPADTARGLAFLAATSLLYMAVFREFRAEAWRRRLAGTVVAVGFLLTMVALVQMSSAEPTRIYGVWRPRWDWAVFGPYVSRNHFAGYMVMAIPLALAFVAEALQSLRAGWRPGRAGWSSLGGGTANALVRRVAVALTLVVGLLASRSRGGLMAFVLSTAVLPLAFRRRWPVAGAFLAIGILGLVFVDLEEFRRAFEARGIRSSRLELWADASGMWRRFPVLGSGLNTFGTAYMARRTVRPSDWYGEAHNEYLQALLDTGIAGAALLAGLLGTVLFSAVRAAPRGPREAGYLGSLLALCLHNVVEFNWQIPANALTFAAIAGLAVSAQGAVRTAKDAGRAASTPDEPA